MAVPVALGSRGQMENEQDLVTQVSIQVFTSRQSWKVFIVSTVGYDFSAFPAAWFTEEGKTWGQRSVNLAHTERG